MTAAARRSEFLDAPDAPLVMPPDLTARCAELERELKQRDTTIATLTRELARAMGAEQIQFTEVVDGMLTVTLTSGVVTQRRLVVNDSPTDVSYSYEWVPLPPVPGTLAAVAVPALAALAPSDGEDAGDEFDPTFRALAIHGGAQ